MNGRALLVMIVATINGSVHKLFIVVLFQLHIFVAQHPWSYPDLVNRRGLGKATY
jgi:hypothetical protein